MSCTAYVMDPEGGKKKGLAKFSGDFTYRRKMWLRSPRACPGAE